MNVAGSGEFYPPRFWGLDPLFSAKVKLNIRDVLSLARYPEFPGVFCIGNHPVLGVHVMGDVVSVREKSALIIYEVDDGSGVLNCAQWRRSKDSADGLYVPDIGQLVSVFGQVEEYREEKQLRVAAVVPEADPNAEPCHWLEVEHARRTVYSQTFTLPDGVTEAHNGQQKKKRPVKAVVTEALMTFLRGKDEPFTLSSVSSSEEVTSAVWEAVRSEEGAGGEEGKSEGKLMVEREIRAVTKSLPKTGLVIPVTSSTATSLAELEYELLSEKKHLFPVILSYIEHKLQHPRAAHLGVPQDWIVQYVRGREGLSHIPPAAVKAAIAQLEDDSMIYSVSDGAYKTVH